MQQLRSCNASGICMPPTKQQHFRKQLKLNAPMRVYVSFHHHQVQTSPVGSRQGRGTCHLHAVAALSQLQAPICMHESKLICS